MLSQYAGEMEHWHRAYVQDYTECLRVLQNLEENAAFQVPCAEPAAASGDERTGRARLRPRPQAFVADQKSKGAQPLNSYLIMPVQRLCVARAGGGGEAADSLRVPRLSRVRRPRYPLLLSEMKKRVDKESEDAQRIESALRVFMTVGSGA